MLSVAIRRLEQILSVYRFSVESEPGRYRLMDNGDRIANITYGITTEEIEGEQGEQQDVLSIFFLNVNPDYQRQGIATWLLLYTICSVTSADSTLKYSVVDDMTDEGNRVGPNLYESIGFCYRVQPVKKYFKNGFWYWNICGPERILSVKNLHNNVFSIIHKLSKKVINLFKEIR